MLQILGTGLRRSGKGMLGPGIYWSDDLTKAKAYSDGTLLKLSIAQGKTQTVDRQDHPMRVTWVAAGYHTSVVPPKCGMVPSGLGEMCTSTRSVWWWWASAGTTGNRGRRTHSDRQLRGNHKRLALFEIVDTSHTPQESEVQLSCPTDIRQCLRAVPACRQEAVAYVDMSMPSMSVSIFSGIAFL